MVSIKQELILTKNYWNIWVAQPPETYALQPLE